jgi:hypothetical protein
MPREFVKRLALPVTDRVRTVRPPQTRRTGENHWGEHFDDDASRQVNFPPETIEATGFASPAPATGARHALDQCRGDLRHDRQRLEDL